MFTPRTVKEMKKVFLNFMRSGSKSYRIKGFLIHKNILVSLVSYLNIFFIYDFEIFLSLFKSVRPIFLDDAILITIRRKNEGRCYSAGNFSCPLYCTVYIRTKVYVHMFNIHKVWHVSYNYYF